MTENQSQRMDLKVDYAFKQMFGQPKNSELLITFLNVLLKRSEFDKIVSIQFPNTELTAETLRDKESRLDVFAITDTEERINVEIQLSNDQDMAKRSLYYWACLFRGQATVGMQYRELSRTIAISIVNFNYFSSTPSYHTTYHVRNDETSALFSDALEIHFVELPKLRKVYRGNVTQALQDPLQRWLMLLDAANNEIIFKELEAIAMKDPIMDQAMSVWDEISRDPDNWAAYLARHWALMDKASDLSAARYAGQEKGIQQGLQQGLQQGIQQERLEIARNLLMMKYEAEQVANATSLTLQQVEDIQQSLN